MGCCNNGFGGGGCLWIILLIRPGGSFVPAGGMA